jgi:CelD/BcsL family acetyltransferase involved in cellulose biosynthesis
VRSAAASATTAPPTTSMSSPTMTVHASFDEVPRDEWNRFAAGHASGAYLSHEHCATWWSRYGDRRSPRLFVFRADGAIVGLLPMFVETVRLGPAWIRRASLVGSDSTPVVLDPPLDAAHAREALAQAVRRLVVDERCDAVRFAPLSGRWPHADALRDAVASLGGAARIARDVETGPHVVFDLPDSFDAYLASLDKRRRGDWRRGMKALRETHAVSTDVVRAPNDVLAEFERFRRLHDAQWAAEGKLGHFRDWPRAEAYHRDLVRVHGADGRAFLVRILVDGEPISYQLCYGFAGTLHWILPARALDAEYERHSLGRLGLVEMIDFAIRAGYRRIEAGVGRYDYKLQHGGTEHQVRSIVVVRDAAFARARLATFARLARVLDAAYYRGWFLRVAPRLPLPRRPLWKSWIRSRP